MLQEYYSNASVNKKLAIKLFVAMAAILTTIYAIFRAYYINFTPYLAPFAVLLYIAELHTIILMYGMYYSIWPRNYKIYKKFNNSKNYKINLFVTVCGEPIEVVKETIKHAKMAADNYTKVVKPKEEPKVIVLNDGKAAKKDNWQEVAQVCDELGVYHLARETNEGFKAGNINNGIKQFPSDDPHNTIDCFFDSDFCAKENFLLEILKPLADDEVDFVQSPQRYKNLNTWVAQAAGAHQIFFFDYICPAKAYDNALFLCGTNYAIRRQALLDTDGVENRFVTEDYATSIKLHLKAKKGVFVSKILAKGMAPMNLKEYFNQQTRWCKGCLDANGAYLKELFFGPLTWRQKFHYFISSAYYFIGIRDMILVLAPISFLFFGVSLVRANTAVYLAFVYLPLIISNFFLFFLTFRYPVKSLVLDLVSFPVFAAAFVSSVIKRNLPFTITIKKYEKENPFKVYKTQLAIAVVLALGLVYSFHFNQSYNVYGRFINHFWATYSASFLFLGFYLVVRENYDVGFIEDKAKNFLSSLFDGVDYGRRTVVNPAFATVSVGSFIVMVGFGFQQNPQVLAGRVEQVRNITKQEYLAVPGSSIYYGYYSPEFDNHPSEFNVGSVEEEQPSLVMFYQDWDAESKFNKRFMNDLYTKGSVPIVTWEPWNASDESADLNEMGKTASVVLSGKYDDHIRQWARGAKDFNRPFYLRFAHEMNGNWYPWGDHNGFSEFEYIKMWKHVWHIFEEEGADNVIWLWSPNNTNHYGENDEILWWYPGDSYVDWVGMSAFNWGTTYEHNVWRDFKTMTWTAYEQLITIEKPIMITETSSASYGGDKGEWFRETFMHDIPEMPWIRAVVIFNKDFGKADFNLDSGMDHEDVINEVIIDNGYYLNKPIFYYQ